jgi:hypothetical protein
VEGKNNERRRGRSRYDCFGVEIVLNTFWYRFTSGARRTFMLGGASVVVLVGLGYAQEQPTPPPPQSQQQEKPLPDAPSASQQDTDKKDANPNPVQEAVDTTRDLARMQILRARDWESGLISGIYVGKNRKLVPLTREERENYYLRQTFLTPEAYIKRAFAALIDQARGVPAWQGGIGGYAERFASREGQFFTSNSIAALGNAKLGYEVRYDKCKCADFKHRLRHAVMRNFLTYDRTEENLRPQFALYGGAFAGGLVSTAWKPSPQDIWKNAGFAVLGQALYGSAVNLITEFSTEINKKQGVGR